MLLINPFPAERKGMERNEKGINPALNDMILREQLSAEKISELIRLREIVERFAMSPYLSAKETDNLEERYGARPDVQTWGDYFQTEIASRYFDLEDEDFSRIIDTVRFDLISAVMIFRDKPAEFLDYIYREGIRVQDTLPENWTEDQEEAAHLFILRNYFLEMNLEECVLNSEDSKWFEGFVGESGARAV